MINNFAKIQSQVEEAKSKMPYSDQNNVDYWISGANEEEKDAN